MYTVSDSASDLVYINAESYIHTCVRACVRACVCSYTGLFILYVCNWTEWQADLLFSWCIHEISDG